MLQFLILEYLIALVCHRPFFVGKRCDGKLNYYYYYYYSHGFFLSLVSNTLLTNIISHILCNFAVEPQP
jgi:hypothetical protein